MSSEGLTMLLSVNSASMGEGCDAGASAAGASPWSSSGSANSSMSVNSAGASFDKAGCSWLGSGISQGGVTTCSSADPLADPWADSWADSWGHSWTELAATSGSAWATGGSSSTQGT